MGYILWTDYGYEGWHPTDCETLDEVWQRALEQGSNQIMITSGPIKVSLVESSVNE